MVFSLNFSMGNFRIFLVIGGISCNSHIFFRQKNLIRNPRHFATENGLFYAEWSAGFSAAVFRFIFRTRTFSIAIQAIWSEQTLFYADPPQNKRSWGVWFLKLKRLRGVSATISTVIFRQKLDCNPDVWKKWPVFWVVYPSIFGGWGGVFNVSSSKRI